MQRQKGKGAFLPFQPLSTLKQSIALVSGHTMIAVPPFHLVNPE
jgi:hypothetical protein